MKMWTHTKYKARQYRGSYKYITKTGINERVFVLSYMDAKLKVHNISFDSWQAAKKLGWVIA